MAETKKNNATTTTKVAKNNKVNNYMIDKYTTHT